MKINLNDTVKVKLTDHGKDIFYHQFDDAIKMGAPLKPHMPKTDADGYTKFPLHDFINTYGNYINMFMPNVIDPIDIVYDYNMSNDWISVNDRLPDNSKTVLITYSVNDNERRYVSTGECIGSEWVLDIAEYFVGRVELHYHAWRPLPDPYKGA